MSKLQLLQVAKHGCRYSTNVITLPFLWQLTSSAAYKKLRLILILPSIARLRQYSAGISVDTCQLDISYLTVRRNDLPSNCRTVVPMIDEVYTAQRVEYNQCWACI